MENWVWKLFTGFGQTGFSLMKAVYLWSIQGPLPIKTMLLRPIVLTIQPTIAFIEVNLFMNGLNGGGACINT